MISEPMPILSIILHVVALIALVASIGVKATYHWSSPSGAITLRGTDREATWRMRILLIIVSGGVEYLAGYVAGWWA